jgi:thymidylate kinase
LGIERVWEINKEAVQDYMPDMILFMDLDVETGLKRTFDEEGDKRERKGIAFFEKAYA